MKVTMTKKAIIACIISGIWAAGITGCTDVSSEILSTEQPTAYVSEEVVDNNVETQTVQETQAPAFETWYVSANSGLNCRDNPSTSGNILTTYPKGTELQIIGIDDTGKWWQTWDGTTQGWCYSTYFVDSLDKLTQATQQATSSTSGTVGAYLGNFRITGYTTDISENGGSTLTAMGDNVYTSVGWAIAVDPKVIPLGTKVYIEGIGYRVARDTGGAIKGNKIDVLVNTKSEAYALTGYYDVYLAE